MKNIMNKIFMLLFPERQLLIRQNGEVKFVTFSPKFQLFISLLIIAALIWAGFTSQKYFSQKHSISQAKSKLLNNEHKFETLSETYKQKQKILADKLNQLQQQQNLLKNIQDSLPETLQPKIKENVAPISMQTPSENNILKNMSLLEQKLNQLASAQKNSFTHFENQLIARQQKIEQAFDQAGIDPQIVQQTISQKVQAQGGPVYAVSEHLISAENLKLADILINLNELETALQSIPITLPAEDYYISSSYGFRKDPITKRRAMHKGIDMAGWIKTKLFSPADGKVKRAGKNGGYGNFIEIDHQNGFVTRYGHLHKIKVKVGQMLSKNDVIGLMGSTGRSTSTHLHYEVLFNNQTLNPLKLSKALTHVL